MKQSPRSRQVSALMRLAIEEATRGLGRTSPDPAVGVLIVKDGRIIFRAYRKKSGPPEPEIVAIRGAGARARGATLYTTLEPGERGGSGAQIAQAIINAGITRVVYASAAPHSPAGSNIRTPLKNAGVEVVSKILQSEANALNRPYLKFLTTGLPWVSLKAAITLDGKLALASGQSKWITGALARKEVHELRSRVDAILVGKNTVLQDDPELTVRLKGYRGKSPLRVVVDSKLSLGTQPRLFQSTTAARTVIALAREPDSAPRASFATLGVELWSIDAKDGRVDLSALMRRMGEEGCRHVLVEGGATIFSSFLSEALADELYLFMAPTLLGDPARSWLGNMGIDSLKKAITLKGLTAKKLDLDLLLHGFF